MSRHFPRGPAGNRNIFIGADYGGTWLRVLALDARGRRKFFVRQPSPSPARLPNAIRKILIRRKVLPATALVIGARGFWKSAKRRKLKAELKGAARWIKIFSDVEIAHRAAFGNSAGILIIAGTGSIAYGKSARGQWARAGGLGPEKGDEGSAFWIGRQALLLKGKKADPRKSLRRVAALAQSVIRDAQRGRPEAVNIVAEGHAHLARLAERLAGKLKFGSSVRIALGGGLFQSGFFRNGFQRVLRLKLTGKRMVEVRPRTDSSQSAAQLALRGD